MGAKRDDPERGGSGDRADGSHSPGYRELADFIMNKMRMVHVYQPLMIETMLNNGGRATAVQVAEHFLRSDPAQLDYYIYIVNRWPRRILKTRGIISEEGRGNRNRTFSLQAGRLTETERDELASMCRRRLAEYKEAKGVTPHYDRFNPRKGISSSKRYAVIAKSAGRCVACGVSSQDRSIDVDHIIPRNRGGSDDISNLQPLCYQCNREKRDKDDLDFLLEHNRRAFGHRGCKLCRAKKIGIENPLAGALHPKDGEDELHTIVLPKRHARSFFELRPPERSLLTGLIDPVQRHLSGMDDTIRDFRVSLDPNLRADDSYHCFINVIPVRAR